MDQRQQRLAGLAAHGMGRTADQHRHGLAILEADLAIDGGVADRGGETATIEVDVLEVAGLVGALAAVAEEVQLRRLAVEAQAVEAELGVVQAFGEISQGNAVLATVAGLVVARAVQAAAGVAEAALVDVVGGGKIVADRTELGLLPFVLVVELQVEAVAEAVLGEHLARRKQALLDLHARHTGFAGIGRTHGRGDAVAVVEAFAPTDDLPADAQVERALGQGPVAVDVRVE
ncbi:hypothetical protein D3C85_1201990 [compost metagenome]